MSDINWQENAVCYFDGEYHYDSAEGLVQDGSGYTTSFYNAMNYDDFQLNEIRTGDFIPASELDTEQKYNDVVEVFGLFGFSRFNGYGYTKFKDDFDTGTKRLFLSGTKSIMTTPDNGSRQLTYSQIIAIGKLKRMMLEREKPAPIDDHSVQAKLSNIGNVLHNLSCSESDEDVQGELEDYAFYLWDLSKSMVNEKSAPKTTAEHDDQVKNPKHYQLIEGVESIEVIARSMTKEQWKGFCLGNMLKYRIRAGKKDALQQDIEKANFYGDLYEMHKGKCYD